MKPCKLERTTRWSLTLLAASLLLAVPLAGCSEDGEPASACTSDSDCKGDRLCVAGACQSPDASGDADTSSGDTTGEDTSSEDTSSEDTSTGDQTTSADTSGEDTTPDAEPDAEPDTPPADPDLLASGESAPQGIVKVGDTLYWTNHETGGCVRHVPAAGGERARNAACESGGLPYMVIGYGDGIAWTSSNGEVKFLGAGDASPTVVATGQQFESSSGNAYCNDNIAAQGDWLVWTTDFDEAESIGRYNAASGVTDSLNSQAPFPDGLAVTPTTIYYSDANFLHRYPLEAPSGATNPEMIIDTGASGCATVTVGETVYIASGAPLGGGTSTLYEVTQVGADEIGSLGDAVFYLAVDETYLYLATANVIGRTPLATLETPTTLLEVPVGEIGGLAVDESFIYYTNYSTGDVRRMAKP